MFRKSIKRTVFVAAAATAGVLLFSCTEDNNPSGYVSTGDEDAVLITRLDDGVSYAQAVDLAAAGELNDPLSQRNATQVISDWAFTFSYGKHVYVSGYDASDVTRYGIGSDGSLREEGSLSIPANAWPAGMAFSCETKAYVSLYATGRVIAFNPETMEKITSIDLTGYAAEGFNVSPASMIIQGDRLVVTLHQMQGQMTFDTKAHAVIIDIDKDTVIAHITDERGSWAGSRESVPSMFVDDEGDLYIACSACFGMAGEAPEGILRIKNGATEFDEDYFWDVSGTTLEGEGVDAANELPSTLYSVSYYKETKGVGILINTAFMAEDEDMMTGHYYKPVEFDYAAKTITVLDLPTGGGYGHGMNRYGEKFLFAFEVAGDENGVYEYDPATGDTKLLFTTEAPPCYIVEIEK
jgi:hypothetical protein